MRYKTLLDPTQIDTLIKELKEVAEDGIWLLDMDPRADKMLIGGYDTIADAHEDRDYIWHYGAKFGRYLWVMTQKGRAEMQKMIKTLEVKNKSPFIELEIDTLPMEVISVRMICGTIDVRYPSRRRKKV